MRGSIQKNPSWGWGEGPDVVLVINIFHSLQGQHTDRPSHGPPFFRGVHTRISRETIATRDFPWVWSRSPVPTAGSDHLFLKNHTCNFVKQQYIHIKHFQ